LKNISVFGGSGFIGGTFSSTYPGAIDLVSRDNPKPKFPDILYCISTTDNYNVFHNPTLDFQTNLIKLVNDLEVIRNNFSKFTFNFVSSWFVYGKSNRLPFQEDDCCDPRGFYSISKLAAEKIVRSYCETYGSTYRIMRLCNVFGRNDKKISSKKNAVQYLIGKLKKNEDVYLYEGGEVTRDFMDVRDIAEALGIILNNAQLNRTINVGSGIETKIIDIITEAKFLFGSTSKILAVPTPSFHQLIQGPRAFLEVSYLNSLGFAPAYPLLKELRNL
jgi:nucleoside-diphosphate-sugar epimerase